MQIFPLVLSLLLLLLLPAILETGSTSRKYPQLRVTKWHLSYKSDLAGSNGSFHTLKL